MPMTPERTTGLLRELVCWSVFAALLAVYWITAPPTVSYWDCPEYVSAAYLLEIGHPPGNPFWMLVERVVTMLAPSPQYAAYAVNLSSGLFTALAGSLLARALFPVTLWLLRRRDEKGVRATTAAAGVSLIAGLTFGWCDSAWYSAVEAEVYAMSIFFTALTVWLMVRWAFMHDRVRANRYLVLLAYIFGLSLGVHQLNLLVIPGLALVWGLRRGIRRPSKLILIVILGMVVVGAVLAGMMPGSIALAANMELWVVNAVGAPPLWGVVLYVLLLGTSLLLALTVTSRSHNRGAVAAAIFPAIFMSGIFAVKGSLPVSAALSAIVTLLLVQPSHFDVRRLNLAFWMLSMLLLGYGAYALIPIRGDIPSPANPTMPGEPFAFAAYQAREQYGGAPLVYGPTPYSRPLLQEEWISGEKRPIYRRYFMKLGHRIVVPYEEGVRFPAVSGALTHADSLMNARVVRSGNPGYLVRGYTLSNLYTPELNAWFPRITSRDPSDLPALADWAGMDTASMNKVRVSEAVDSLGHPVAKMLPSGRRDTVWSYKPTLIQNMRMLLVYQTGYMYMRYLMWNFCGRQNDIPSQGEVEHGNFITGVMPLDNLMLGAEDSLPPEAGRNNPGRNVYWGLPLILGVAGLIWLCTRGPRGRAAAAVTFLLFFMTGIAIVIYLNQSPGEPRERDYSFLGSFWIFAAWTGYGALWLARRLRTGATFLLLLLVPVWMCAENFNDHDRRGRRAATTIATSILEGLDKDAVLFVDGDNFTFPLWYAQEVEGVRRDVRVVNISYLGLGRYAANQLGPWRDAVGIPATLRRTDVIYDGLRGVRVAPGCRDTLPAVEMLRQLRATPEGTPPELKARYALLPLAPGDTLVYDIYCLTSGGKGGNITLAKLLTFDAVATAAYSDRPRPIYWINNIGKTVMPGLPDRALTQTLMTMRFGTRDTSDALDEVSRGVAAVRMPNALDRRVYLDATPGRMTAILRGNLVKAARRQLAAGRWREALVTLDKCSSTMGEYFNTYTYMSDGDSVMDVRLELGRLQQALADTIEKRNPVPYMRARAVELRARGRRNHILAERRVEQWRKYRKALPPELQGLTAPVY